jgi:glucose-1-phosphate thymidylyltransferase
MRSIKAIFPVAGVGTRLRPHTLTQPKVLLPVAGKPMLQHIIDELIPFDIDEYLYIVGHLAGRIEEFITETYRVKSQFIRQNERLGLGHAIYLAREFVDPEDALLIILGDTLFELDLNALLGSDRSLIGVKEIDDPSRFGVVQLEAGTVKRFIEKPEKPVSNLAIVGIYYVQEARTLMNGLAYIIEHGLKTKGEYQLTDALQHMIDEGHSFGTIPVEGWFDCGKPETLLSTNRHFLEKHFSDAEPHKTGITPPCCIGESVTLRNATIGPFVSMGNDCSVQDSVISNSIILDNVSISDARIKNSIIGSNTSVKGGSFILNTGEYTSIELNK